MLPYNTCSAAANKNGGGILRKPSGGVSTTTTNNVVPGVQVELLVFGYACKVFRDDAKAWEIDKGKHLIPWMGDPNLKIDRYDVRGALSDLTPYEPPPGGYGNRLDYLSADEQRAEQLCEEERYFFLYNNEEDHILQQEEDLKRLQQEALGCSYGRVGFQYDTSNGTTQHGPKEQHQNTVSNVSDETEQQYIMPKNLQVPISIQLPDTMKQHAIIEKTARFIAAQGVQMEILLKAKQSNNVQFDFLAQNGLLNPYYKFVVSTIKNGTYPAEESAKDNDSTLQNEMTAQIEHSSQYTKPIITVPTIKYQPSANCAYTQLISKIKGVPLPEFLNDDANAETTSTATATDAIETPILLQYNTHTYVQADEENISISHSNTNTQEAKEPQVEILKNSSAWALAQNYSSDSESDEETNKSPPPPEPEPVLNFPVPSDNLKNIIDKTATYVIKNGRQFEETLRTKSEDRFTFLMPENEFYAYYMYKISGDPDAASKERKARKAAAVAAALLSKKGLTTPVSFSIKASDQSATTLPPALPQEPSDDDDDEHSKKSEANSSSTTTSTYPQRSVPEHVQKAIQLVESQLMARNAQFSANNTSGTNSNNTTTGSTSSHLTSSSNENGQNSTTTSTRSRFDLDYSAGSSKNQIKSTKTELERNALYEQQQQNRLKELKKAEEKVKDKLAQIAREKLGGLISKDKQLQLERKRKAMAFLNQIKGISSGSKQESELTSSIENDPRKAENKDGNGNASDSSEESVHSIPITSYGPEDDDEPEMSMEYSVIASGRDVVKTVDKLTAPTVLLSDDDDVELISEQKATTSVYDAKRHRYHENRKGSRSSRIGKREKEKCEERKYSPQPDESSSCSPDTPDSKYNGHRRHKSRRDDGNDDEPYSSHKSKKMKKSSKQKKKKKHKSSSGRDRSPSTISQVSRSSRHSKHSRHNSRCRSRSASESVSVDSDSTTESQRRKLYLYELDDRVTYTPPASPRRTTSSRKSSSTSSRRTKRKRSHYDD